MKSVIDETKKKRQQKNLKKILVVILVLKLILKNYLNFNDCTNDLKQLNFIQNVSKTKNALKLQSQS